MNRVLKDLKVLKSMRTDIETRLRGRIKESLSGKLQKFIVNIQVLEQSLQSSKLPDSDMVQVLRELDDLKSASNRFQEQVNNYPLQSSSKEEEILQNLQVLKEISSTILHELESQNQNTEKSLKTITTNEEIILKARSRLSNLEKFLDFLPTPCLLTSMVLTFLSTFLVISIL